MEFEEVGLGLEGFGVFIWAEAFGAFEPEGYEGCEGAGVVD